MSEKFDENYYMRGEETGVSNYTNYRWLPELTIPMALYLKKFLNIEEGETLLDFGCGRGYLVKALRMLDVVAFGQDISNWAIENCDPDNRAFLYGHYYPYHQFNYDHLFSKDVLEHIEIKELKLKLNQLLINTLKSALFIVPLAEVDGGKYIYPNDELDTTHVLRYTLDTWMQLVQEQCNENFIVFGSYNIPILKKSIEKYPKSAGFIYCTRIKHD